MITPVNAETAGLAKYADEPLASIPAAPMSVKFLVEHRTALNGKTVTVQGFVVATILGKAACPGGGIGACSQPRVFLADTTSEARDKNYDTVVLVSETEETYATGQSATIKCIVASSKASVYLTKSY